MENVIMEGVDIGPKCPVYKILHSRLLQESLMFSRDKNVNGIYNIDFMSQLNLPLYC